MTNKKEGQLRKIFPVIILVLLLSILIVAAESINKETSTTLGTQTTEVPSKTLIEIPSETRTIVVEDNSETANSEVNTKIPEEIWNKWKDTIPCSISLNKALIELLKKEGGENE